MVYTPQYDPESPERRDNDGVTGEIDDQVSLSLFIQRGDKTRLMILLEEVHQSDE